MPQLPLFDIFNRISDFVKNAMRVMVIDSSGQQVENFGQTAFSDKDEADKKGLVDEDRHQQVDILSSLDYTLAIEYDANDNPIYIGQAESGTAKTAAGWRIKKLTWFDGNCIDIQWADGTNAFTKIWDNRATYSYS